MSNQTCGCGNHDKPVNPANAEVREEIKIVPAEGSVDKVVAPEGEACGCGHEAGQCNCGHHQTCDCPPGECKCEGHNHGHNHGHDHGEGRHDDEIGRDNVNADTDGAVTTVETAETHRPGTDWNGDNLGAATGEATESGAGEAEKGNLN